MSKMWRDIQICPVQFTGHKKHLKNDRESKFTFRNIPLLTK